MNVYSNLSEIDSITIDIILFYNPIFLNLL